MDEFNNFNQNPENQDTNNESFNEQQNENLNVYNERNVQNNEGFEPVQNGYESYSSYQSQPRNDYSSQPQTPPVYDYTYGGLYPVQEVRKKKKRKVNPAVVVLSSALAVSLIVSSVLGISMLTGKKAPEKNGSVYHSSNVAGGKKTDGDTQNTQFIPNGKELTTTEIAAKVGPAVVGIVCKTKTVNFFNQMGEAESSGSGVIISEDGYIVTNNHVIESANTVKIVLNSGDEYEAKLVGADSRSDIAVLKIDAKDLPFASIGDSSTVMVGDKAVAIGNPLGTELMGTVTEGIISAVNRTVTIEDKKLTLLQTDAAINSGNSGGALVNAYGEVIGINSVKMAAAGVEGIGFAIPSNVFKPIIDDLIDSGYVKGRLMIGVAGTNITKQLSEYYELPEGFYVNQVYEGYGAYLAGVQPGDVIIKCDGKVTKTIDDINAIRDSHKVGDIMTITVSRDGKNVDLKVKLMEENPEITNNNQ